MCRCSFSLNDLCLWACRCQIFLLILALFVFFFSVMRKLPDGTTAGINPLVTLHIKLRPHFLLSTRRGSLKFFSKEVLMDIYTCELIHILIKDLVIKLVIEVLEYTQFQASVTMGLSGLVSSWSTPLPSMFIAAFVQMFCFWGKRKCNFRYKKKNWNENLLEVESH